MKDLNQFLNEESEADIYLGGLESLLLVAKDIKHPVNTSRALKTYYENALKVGINNNLIDNLLRKRINKKNREIGKLSSGKTDRESIIEILEYIINEIK
tara:strand:+ start:16426 stop:16722 length:297 start_codon:yes stop_codon:yes gene_type:complete